MFTPRSGGPLLPCSLSFLSTSFRLPFSFLPPQSFSLLLTLAYFFSILLLFFLSYSALFCLSPLLILLLCLFVCLFVSSSSSFFFLSFFFFSSSSSSSCLLKISAERNLREKRKSEMYAGRYPATQNAKESKKESKLFRATNLNHTVQPLPKSALFVDVRHNGSNARAHILQSVVRQRQLRGRRSCEAAAVEGEKE